MNQGQTHPQHTPNQDPGTGAATGPATGATGKEGEREAGNMVTRASTIAKRQQRRTEHARKGGLATRARHGQEHYARIGKLGGRPTFHEALAKARTREAEAQSKGVGPGRPRKAPPTGETKETPAETAACQEPIPAETRSTNTHQANREVERGPEHPQKGWD